MASSPVSIELVRFGPYEANLRSRELRRDGVSVRLPDQSFEVLVMLLEHPGELVTREEIHKRLWTADTFVDFDHGLNNAVNRLRDALGEAAEAPRFVETLPRRGYRFIGSIERAEDPTDVIAQDTPDALQRIKPTRHWRIAYRSVAILVLLSLAVVIFFAKTRRLKHPAIHSLVVLPFQNLSGDQGQDYFVDGMTDELITMLAKNPGLRIISRTSAMQYKNVHRPLPDIARDLGVDGILEGSVGRSGGRVHVTAQLIYAPTDSHIWAESYDRDLSYGYSLQNELALNIARHVGLTASVPAELETRVNPEAYEAYLRARHFANIRGLALRKAVEYYQQATEKEPTFALAYAGLAESQWRSGDVAAAKRSANKAIQIDGTMGEPLATLAQIKAYNEWDFFGAEEDFKRAIALSPNDPTARQWYAQFLHWMGRLDEGMAQIQVGLQLDPLSLIIGTDRAEILLHMNQLDAATAQIKKVVELDSQFGPAHIVLARIYERQRKYDAAISEYGVVGGEPNDPTILAFQAMVYAEAGRTKKAREILSRAEKLAAQSSLPYDGCVLASAYGVLGDRDKAFFWLEREYLARSPSLLTLKVHESFAPLRSDRRFEDLVRRIGFPK